MKRLITAAAVSVTLFTAGCSSDSTPASQADPSIETPSTPSTPSTEASYDGGLLSNAGFKDGSDGWEGNAANVIDDGSGSNNINFASVAAAGNAYDVNLSQILEIVPGKTYTLSFKAKSDAERTIIAGIGLNSGSYANHSETVSLTSEWKTYTLGLTANGFGDDNSRVLFDMGADVGEVWLDDVSLIEVVTTTPDAAPTTAAPIPVDVQTISVFSDPYIAVDGVNVGPVWGGSQTTVVTIEEIADGEVLKYANLNYQGIDLATPAGNTIDVSAMDSLHLDYWTEASSSLDISAISPGPVEKAYNASVTTGSWQSLDIPLSDFTADASGVDLARLMQLKIEGAGTVYLDNIYFYNSNTGRKTIGVYSESMHDSTAEYVINTHGGNPVVAQGSAEVIPVDGSESLEIDWQSLDEPNPGWGGATIDLVAPVDVSSYTNLVLSVNRNNLPAGLGIGAKNLVGDMHIKLEGSAGAGQVFLSELNGGATVTGDWITLRIPLSSFSGLDLSAVQKIGFWSPETTTATATQNTMGKMYFDNIYFEGPEAIAPGAAVDYLFSSDSTVTLKWLADTDFRYDPWGTQDAGDGIFEGNYVGDADYSPVWKIQGASGAWGSTLAMTGLPAGFASGYGNLVFKVKLDAGTEVKVKFPGATTEELSYDISTKGTALSNGWYQMEIPMSDFGSTASTTEFAIFAAQTSTMHLTDIGFNGEPATPAIPAAAGDYIFSSDSSIATKWLADTDFRYDPWGTQDAGDGIFEGNYVGDADYSPVWKIQGASGAWGSTLAMAGLPAGFASGYGNLVFKVKLDAGTEVKVKFPGATTEELPYDISTKGTALSNGWYQMEIPMSDFGSTSSTTEFAIFAAQTSTMHLTDIGFNGEQTTPPAPTESAPDSAAPTPSLNAAGVTAVYSDYYTTVALNAFPTDWSDGSAVDFTIPGTSDNVKKLSAANGVGLEVTSPIDASSYTMLAMDVWLPSLPIGAVINVYARDFGANGTWDENGDDSDVLLQQIVLTDVAEKSWFKVNVPLSGLASQSAIGQMKFGNASSVGNYTMYIDNIHLH